MSRYEELLKELEDYIITLRNEKDEAVRKLSQYKKTSPNWNLVSDSLPILEGDYLIQDDNGPMHVAHYCSDLMAYDSTSFLVHRPGFTITSPTGKHLECVRVYAWTELPDSAV